MTDQPPQREHIPVLLQEVLDALRPAAGEVYADATAGLGGHAAAVAGAMGSGTVALVDADESNLARARSAVAVAAPGVRILGRHANFANLPHFLRDEGLVADMLLADLGFASPQIDDAARGFSFHREGPLDMRFDRRSPLSAADLVNNAPEAELVRIISEFGEERMARRIAQKLVSERRRAPIITTGGLAEVVRSVVPQSPGGIDPATRTFQAIRIAVNDELGSLESLLRSIRLGRREGWLKDGSRVAIISFHSLEDRPVKRAFGEMAREGEAEEIVRGCVLAGDGERERNPRSRSAKLRAVRLK
ncbi:MAG TPA: 16S rRNA (cytosine(1402)-N(4))-methyltransferase RsmH [Phycisphaerales bacterium]|nr:16S rRNA (cytosine(1402)-N(4))-methyltransferase RsmH [Phycisphaerales bacterium]